MKKKLFFAAIAIIALAGCTSNEYLGDLDPTGKVGDGAIGFNLNTAAVTRASGATAATALGNYFIVYGEKAETSKDKYSAGNLVFPNYTVHYGANTAYTTTSNTKDWEYVAETPISTTYVKMYDGSATETAPSEQTIKYWDYGAASYTFTAVSANKEDIENGRVVIQKNTVGANNSYEKGYTITLAKSGAGEPYTYPILNKLYFADLKVIEHGTGADRTETNAYGGNVTLTFRNLVSHIRAGVYETIPGYDITSISFYVNTSGVPPTQTEPAVVSTTPAFGAVCPNIKTTNYEGTLTVTYYESGAVENQPKVTATGTPATNLILGTNLNTISDAADSQLGKIATSPTWDTSAGAYTEVLPQIENTTNLKLKCDYTLWNSVTHETITVTGATAEIPAEYLQWKPNYKYTYLFKISDNTNGNTGASGPAGLWPITFDALEVVAADGVAEYITTVSEPSITTFGAIYYTDSDPTKSKYTTYQTGKDEYQAQSDPNRLDIFVAAVDGSTVVNPTLGTNMNVYLATTTDKSSYPITEASVAEALAEISVGAKKITVTNINDDASTNFGAAPAKATVVPSEDGSILSVKVTLTQSGSNPAPDDWVASDANVYYSDAACTSKVTTAFPTDPGTYTYYKKFDSALMLTGVKATTAAGDADKAIVVEYVKTAATYYTSGAVYTLADESAFNTEVSTNGKLYTNTDGTTELTWAVYNTDASSKAATYYRRTAVKTVGEYAYKVIHITAAP